MATRDAFIVTAHVGAPTVAGDVGYGVRRTIPIAGGEVRGEKVKGRAFPFRADYQLVRPNELVELEARYEIRDRRWRPSRSRTRASASGPRELLERPKCSEAVDPVTVPTFETAAENDRWLVEHIFVASAARHPDRVVIDLFQMR